MIVVKAKNSIQMAINILPKEPNFESNAACARLEPVSPVSSAPVEIITRAVRVRIIKVSINTPIIAIIPWSLGCFTCAVACA